MLVVLLDLAAGYLTGDLGYHRDQVAVLDAHLSRDANVAAALRGGSDDADLTGAQALALANKLGSAETIAKVTKTIEAAFPAQAGGEGNGRKAPKPAK